MLLTAEYELLVDTQHLIVDQAYDQNIAITIYIFLFINYFQLWYKTCKLVKKDFVIRPAKVSIAR
jgi:hypothetical protein